MVRLNITMPEQLVKELHKVKNRSRFIAEAVRERFESEKKRKLQSLLIEGYQKEAGRNKKFDQAWSNTLEDGWQ